MMRFRNERETNHKWVNNWMEHSWENNLPVKKYKYKIREICQTKILLLLFYTLRYTVLQAIMEWISSLPRHWRHTSLSKFFFGYYFKWHLCSKSIKHKETSRKNIIQDFSLIISCTLLLRPSLMQNMEGI